VEAKTHLSRLLQRVESGEEITIARSAVLWRHPSETPSQAMTRYLLDTAVFLWNVGDVSRLKPQVRDLLGDPSNEIYVSAATL
jgi:hypothetical protein